jgi:hypothetical protein
MAGAACATALPILFGIGLAAGAAVGPIKQRNWPKLAMSRPGTNG